MYLNISEVGSVIVVGLLGHGETEHHNKWANIGNKKSNSENFNQLCEGRHEEEHIEEKFELIVEYLWKKGENIVFGIFDQVGLIIDG